ncbi:MAG: class I SAM-dependent methyltransferase [Ferruginibacter sp.]|nr:class I SAM-dependent methyltransferase [Ferruginibacter sp.]
MEFINPLAEAYSKKYSSVLDDLLSDNEQITLASHDHATMHSGQVQGKFLEMISRMITPLRILEIGTFTGFSAICLSKGLRENGLLHTIELRKEDADFAAGYIQRAGVANRIKLHIGNALDIIPSLTEKWDLVFIDADKVNYIEYYELTLPFLNVGGWILADNVLFHGQVLEEAVKGKNAKAMQAFNEHVAADTKVEQVMLTIRDGLMLIRKL